MHNNTVNHINLAYGVVGIILGILISSSFGVGFSSRENSKAFNKMANMHKMPDGSMMPNVGMGMDNMMEGMMLGIKDKKGDDFDKAFLSEMIVHHQGAVDMAKLVLVNSKKVELLKLANDIISAQNKEIEMMQGWEKAWFK